MTETEIRAMADAALTAFNEGDWDRAANCIAEDALVEVGPEFSLKGPHGALQVLDFFAQFYDNSFTDWQVFVDGDEAIVRLTFRCKYHTTMPGLSPATGQVTEVPGALFVTMRDGLVGRIAFVYSSVDWAQITG